MQATVQATTKNFGTHRKTSPYESPMNYWKFGCPRTSKNVPSVDGMQGVRGSKPLTSTDRKLLVCNNFGANDTAKKKRFSPALWPFPQRVTGSSTVDHSVDFSAT